MSDLDLSDLGLSDLGFSDTRCYTQIEIEVPQGIGFKSHPPHQTSKFQPAGHIPA